MDMEWSESRCEITKTAGLKAGIDLRNQVTVNGVCQLSSSDVKHLLSDSTRAKSWSVDFQDGVSTVIDTKDKDKSGDSWKPLKQG